MENIFKLNLDPNNESTSVLFNVSDERAKELRTKAVKALAVKAVEGCMCDESDAVKGGFSSGDVITVYIEQAENANETVYMAFMAGTKVASFARKERTLSNDPIAEIMKQLSGR